MARNVTYSVVPRKNLNDKEAAPKFYARAKATGDIDLREMSERIQQSCTVTKADVHAVLVALEDVIINALKSGEIVRLGDLGTFQIGISSKGAVTAKDYNSSLIKSAHINFRPGVALAGLLTSLTFAKLKTDDDEEETEESGQEEGGEDLTA